MEPDRFDDVESTILEAPEPRERNPLRRRMALVMAIGLTLSGGMAAGASALTQNAEKPVAPAKTVKRGDGWMRYAPMSGSHPCHRGEHRRAPASSDLRY
jgi:FtsH-binding integral membrane protein